MRETSVILYKYSGTFEPFEDYDERGPDVDTEIHCPCGNKFYLYMPDIEIQCLQCKKVYRAMVKI